MIESRHELTTTFTKPTHSNHCYLVTHTHTQLQSTSILIEIWLRQMKSELLQMNVMNIYAIMVEEIRVDGCGCMCVCVLV